ncbi:unnamed protein product, partial [Rotaria sp. Silwood1]
VLAQVSTNMIIDSPTVPIQNGLASNVSLDGFQQVENKKNKKIKRKLTTSAVKKKRIHYQTNTSVKPDVPFIPSVPTPIHDKSLLRKEVQQVDSIHHVQGISHVPSTQPVQNGQELQGIHQFSGGPQAQGASPSSHSQQISITTESTRYAQTRYSFPPFIIRFNVGKVASNQIKEGLTDYCNLKYQIEINFLNCRLSNRSFNNEYDFLLFLKDASSFSFLLGQNHWPISFGNENYTFPSSSSIPPQLSLLIKNVDRSFRF